MELIDSKRNYSIDDEAKEVFDKELKNIYCVAIFVSYNTAYK